MVRDGAQDHDLSLATLHGSLADPALESMNFLNEIAGRYPEAVSFASGRPCEEFFDVKLIHLGFRGFGVGGDRVVVCAW